MNYSREQMPEQCGGNIAVIAVHGVADQQPRESARTIANLLQNLDAGGQPLYDPFIERELRISVRPFRVPNPSKPWKKEPDFELARQALKGYEGEPADEVFETVRLEGCRSEGRLNVHVYECYWADLSRLGAGVTRFFGELYQLFFHLTRVAYHTVEASARAHEKSWTWWIYQHLVNLSSTLLTWPVAVFNLFLAALTLTIVSVGLLNNATPILQRSVTLGLLALVSWTALAVVLRRRVHGFLPWLIVSLLPLLVVAPLGWLWFGELGSPTALPRAVSYYVELALLEQLPSGGGVLLGHLQVFASLIALLCAGGLALVIRAYSRRRPGVGTFAALFGAAALFLFAEQIWQAPNAPSQIIQACMNVLAGTGPGIQNPTAVLQWLRLSWGLLLISLLATAAMGWLVVIPANRPDATVRRAVWTASLTTALPVLAFLVTTTALWSAVSTVAAKTLPSGFVYRDLPADQLGPTFLSGQFAQFFAPLFILVALAVLIAAWALLPVVWTEVRPPKRRRRQANGLSVSVGTWLNNGYKALTISGVLLYVGVLAAAGGALYLVFGVTLPLVDEQRATRVVTALGTALGCSAAGLMVLRGRLKKVTAGFRTVLDILLDVDNHLKDRPVTASPRARIAARYASLLRYICMRGREGSGTPYDGIVIIAHSEGSVITADLFRLLRAEQQRAGSSEAYDPALALLDGRLPVYLFTMGCPLNQLYGVRFPDLYRWARNEEPRPLPVPWAPGDITGLQPDPNELGVRQWVNAFRSGDYIGRQLWRHERCSYRFRFPELLDETGPWPKELAPVENVSSDQDRTRIEFCIGPGAHTHYWDKTAPEIVGELDRIVDRAAKGEL